MKKIITIFRSRLYWSQVARIATTFFVLFVGIEFGFKAMRFGFDQSIATMQETTYLWRYLGSRFVGAFFYGVIIAFGRRATQAATP